MPEYKRPSNQSEFRENFKLKKPLMNDTEALYESSRCLFCYDAPCVTACPTGIDIPLFIKQIHTQNTEGAARTIYDSNWLGNTCGTVCPTGVLCEGACVYNHQNVKPLQIGRLQNYATRTVMDKERVIFKSGVQSGRKVAVIGAGPAGLACAAELRVLGHEVTVFEAKALPSGLALHGVAPYKISNEEVLEEVSFLQNQLGFEIKYNAPISTKSQIEELENEFDAIFLGVGLGPTKNLKIPGEDLNGVVGAVEFIEPLKVNGFKTQVPDRVVVIGGGNTAMDAASECARLGAKEVTLAYRRGKDEMGAYGFEYDLAVSAGVKGVFNVNPVEILGEDKVTGIRLAETEIVDDRLKVKEDSSVEIACDMVIMSVGQSKYTNLYGLIEGLELDGKNRISVDNDSYQTTNPKYFSGGDAVNGGAEVVNAAYEGKMAAQGIDNWFNQTR